MIIDFDLPFLHAAVALVDGQLEILHREVKSSPDPDSYGIFDRIEYLTGFGLVACQTYATSITGVARVNKGKALELGPRHRTGRSMIQLINAAANYWKHSPEWSLDAHTDQAEKTLETIESLGVVTDIGQYPIANTLYEMLKPHNARFANLIPFLTQWRDALRG
jgi:hypothetical protein